VQALVTSVFFFVPTSCNWCTSLYDISCLLIRSIRLAPPADDSKYVYEKLYVHCMFGCLIFFFNFCWIYCFVNLSSLDRSMWKSAIHVPEPWPTATITFSLLGIIPCLLFYPLNWWALIMLYKHAFQYCSFASCPIVHHFLVSF